MISGVHHFSFSVTNIQRTIDFYTRVLGVKLQSQGRNKYETLGDGPIWNAMGNKPAACRPRTRRDEYREAARVEFLGYTDPKAQCYHTNPSIAGSAHLAFRVDNILETRRKLEEAGVEFSRPDRIPIWNPAGWNGSGVIFAIPTGLFLNSYNRIRLLGIADLLKFRCGGI